MEKLFIKDNTWSLLTEDGEYICNMTEMLSYTNTKEAEEDQSGSPIQMEKEKDLTEWSCKVTET